MGCDGVTKELRRARSRAGLRRVSNCDQNLLCFSDLAEVSGCCSILKDKAVTLNLHAEGSSSLNVKKKNLRYA